MTLVLNVPSIVCTGCADAIAKAITTVDETAKVGIDLTAKRVVIESKLPQETLTQAITEIGHIVEA